ncbi:21448_t:CDS:2 [Dentiscutata erythropus]|uniref:21448_t:CDS:1 n=1 Tax=Dentiscutata erythropus TaxID=1348616 RepID=A0A9N8VUU1_9GLOM|nr:21448_t:CDS:2 [Dentiscutata erythropus]
MADSIYHKFDKYYLNINDTTKIATILDPHIKCSVFAIGDETNNTIFLLHSKIVHYSTTATLVLLNLIELFLESLLLNQSNAHSYLRNFANQFCPTTTIQPNIRNELERYFAIPINENCDLWKDIDIDDKMDYE